MPHKLMPQRLNFGTRSGHKDFLEIDSVNDFQF